MTAGTEAPLRLRLVITPAAGRVRLLPPRRFLEGREIVEAGQPLARLEQGHRHTVIRTPVNGSVSSVLAIEGEPVVPNQPLFAIEPEDE
ncbi:MAG TPA: biotin/lipoyl-containing protein [Actinomycetota bacterium]|nr:biotin/lipoyl-containing protein [Actinomycetota bacterium]